MILAFLSSGFRSALSAFLISLISLPSGLVNIQSRDLLLGEMIKPLPLSSGLARNTLTLLKEKSHGHPVKPHHIRMSHSLIDHTHAHNLKQF